MFGWLTRNFGWKVLAVLIATGLWILLHSEPFVLQSGLPVTDSHEPLLSRDLPVEIRLSGIPPKGYTLAAVESIPSSSRLRGGQASVASLISIPTDSVDISELTSEQTLTVPLRLPDPHMLWEGPSEVRVRLVVQRKEMSKQK